MKDVNNTSARQIEQAQLVKSHAFKAGKKEIICGDFNATPYSGTYRLLKKGMTDSYLEKGNRFGRTYSILNYPLRIDYFLDEEQLEVLGNDNFSLN